MNDFVKQCNEIFRTTTEYYHKFDNIDAVPENPYKAGTIENVLFRKTGLTRRNGIWKTSYATLKSTL